MVASRLDVFLDRLQRHTLDRGIGTWLWRFARWAAPRVAPYIPPRTEVEPERLQGFVQVEVRPSTVPGAGLGLFALEPIEAGVTIGEYTGDIVDSKWRWLRLINKDYVALTADPAVSIDSFQRPEAMMRYINHHFRKDRHNVRFHSEGRRKFVETIRCVEPGEEFLADYGELYWRLRGVRPAGN